MNAWLKTPDRGRGYELALVRADKVAALTPAIPWNRADGSKMEVTYITLKCGVQSGGVRPCCCGGRGPWVWGRACPARAIQPRARDR